jgi:hypothetical protein
MLASNDLRAVIKPEGGYVYKDWPFIQGARLVAGVKTAFFITEVKELRVQVQLSVFL